MSREVLSTSRPTALRLAGFLILVAAGALLGIGAVMEWATVKTFDTPTAGVDVWEGKVVLAAAIVTLIGLIAVRLASRNVARVVAVLIILAGIAAVGLATSDALRAQTRFTDSSQLDRYARVLAAQLEEPVESVRATLQQFRDLSVRLGPGIFVAMGGGILAAVGGVLSWRWIGAERSEPPPPDEEDSELP